MTFHLDVDTVCETCARAATVVVRVPWIHVDTAETGWDWLPFCRACYPSAESWETRRVSPAMRAYRAFLAHVVRTFPSTMHRFPMLQLVIETGRKLTC